MDWIELPDGTFDRGVLGGIVVGMIFFIFVALLRAYQRIRAFGLWNYLKSALTIQRDSLGLFLTLLVLLLVVILGYRRGP